MWVHFNGKLVPASRARVSVFDRGFLYGDGVFETMRAYGGRVFRLDAHLERLAASAAAVKIPIPRSPEQLRKDIRALIEKNRMENAVVRLSVSRGVGSRGPAIPDDASPTQVAAVFGLPDDLEARRRKGLRLALVDVRKIPPDALPAHAKLANYLNSILAHAEAVAAGADEALLRSANGSLAECSSANLFIVRDEGLFTPATSAGILPGITRRAVLEIAARAGIRTEETLIWPEALWEAEEVFVTSSVAEVVPVRTVDSRDFTVPGPITRSLIDRYRALVREETGG